MGALVDAVLAARSRAELTVDLWSGLRNVSEGLAIAVEQSLGGRQRGLTDDQILTLRSALAEWVRQIDQHLGRPV